MSVERGAYTIMFSMIMSTLERFRHPTPNVIILSRGRRWYTSVPCNTGKHAGTWILTYSAKYVIDLADCRRVLYARVTINSVFRDSQHSRGTVIVAVAVVVVDTATLSVVRAKTQSPET